jgi:hypothetical protein
MPQLVRQVRTLRMRTFVEAGFVDGLGGVIGDELEPAFTTVLPFNLDVLGGHAAGQAVGVGLADGGGFAAEHHGTFGVATVVFGDDDVLRDVDQAAGEVAGFGGLKGGVGETLAGAVGGVEVLQHREAFFVVGLDRQLDGTARRVDHEAEHTGDLVGLGGVTFGAGVDEDGGGGVAFFELLGDGLGDLLVGLLPGVDGALVALVVGDEALAYWLEMLAACFSPASMISFLESGIR